MTGPGPARGGTWKAACVAAAAALVVYLAARHVTGYDFVNYDDVYLIAPENPAIGKGLAAGLADLANPATSPQFMNAWLPLYYGSLGLDHALGGGAAWVFHLHNVLLHALGAALVAVISRRLGATGFVAGLAGVLFAVHPSRRRASRGSRAARTRCRSSGWGRRRSATSRRSRNAGRVCTSRARVPGRLDAGEGHDARPRASPRRPRRPPARRRAARAETPRGGGSYAVVAAVMTGIHFWVAQREGTAGAAPPASLGTLLVVDLEVACRYAAAFVAPFTQNVAHDVRADAVDGTKVFLGAVLFAVWAGALAATWRRSRSRRPAARRARRAAAFNNVMPRTSVLFAERYAYVALLRSRSPRPGCCGRAATDRAPTFRRPSASASWRRSARCVSPFGATPSHSGRTPPAGRRFRIRRVPARRRVRHRGPCGARVRVGRARRPGPGGLAVRATARFRRPHAPARRDGARDAPARHRRRGEGCGGAGPRGVASFESAGNYAAKVDVPGIRGQRLQILTNRATCGNSSATTRGRSPTGRRRSGSTAAAPGLERAGAHGARRRPHERGEGRPREVRGGVEGRPGDRPRTRESAAARGRLRRREARPRRRDRRAPRGRGPPPRRGAARRDAAASRGRRGEAAQGDGAASRRRGDPRSPRRVAARNGAVVRVARRHGRGSRGCAQGRRGRAAVLGARAGAGIVARRAGKLDDAAGHFRKARDLHPRACASASSLRRSCSSWRPACSTTGARASP